MDPTYISAVVGVIVGLGGLLISLSTAKSTAEKVKDAALATAMKSIAEDYERVERVANAAQAESDLWKRRFETACELGKLSTDEVIDEEKQTTGTAR